jgi:hypothetical protein
MSTFTLTVGGKRIEPTNIIPSGIKPFASILEDTHVAKNSSDTLLFATTPLNCFKSVFGNSLIGSIYIAYNNHYKLILRPDDVWLSIVYTFSDYVVYHSDKLRNNFIIRDNKIKLYTKCESFTFDNLFDSVNDLVDQVEQHTVNSYKKLLDPDFTTTTKKDLLTARIALMGAVQKYFAFSMFMSCGIPEVTLMGDLEDWVKLRNKLDFLDIYGIADLSNWKILLSNICQEFINSYQGNVNNDFWQSAVNCIPAGSGSSDISGWLLGFTPFLKGEWRIGTIENIIKTGEYGNIPTSSFETTNIVEFPVRINDDYDTYIHAGGIVSCFNNNTINPSFDIAMYKINNGLLPNDIKWLPKEQYYDVSTVFNNRIIKSCVHEHYLELDINIKIYRCDVCHYNVDNIAYYCKSCNFYSCLNCINNVSSLSSLSSPNNTSSSPNNAYSYCVLL